MTRKTVRFVRCPEMAERNTCATLLSRIYIDKKRMFRLPPSTTRDSAPSRQTENVIYLVFEDVIVHIVTEVEKRLKDFRYSGNLETDKNIDGDINVSDIRVTNERNVLVACQDGTCKTEKRNCTSMASVFGGGAMFLLDRYVHQFITDGSIPNLIETSGLTSDLDIEFNMSPVTPGGEQMYLMSTYEDVSFVSKTDENLAYKQAVTQFVVQAIREITSDPTYIRYVHTKLDFLSSFVELTPHGHESPDGTILNIDGGKGYFYILVWKAGEDAGNDINKYRININIDYAFGGETGQQHLSDLFLSFHKPSKTDLPQTLQYICIGDKLIPNDFHEMSNQLNAMADRYLNAWKETNGGGALSETPFRRCSNDRRRFLWFIRTLSHPQFPSCLLTGYDSARGYRAGILTKILSDMLVYPARVFRGHKELFDMPDDAVIRKLVRKDGLIHLQKYDEEVKYTPSPMVVRVFRLVERIRAVADEELGNTYMGRWGPNEIRAGLRRYADRLESVFREYEEQFPGSPCMISETPEAARAIVDTYQSIMNHVSPQRWVMHGSETVRGLSFGKWLGRVFAKRAARIIRNLL